MQTVLLTGVAGFIASKTAELLLDQGVQVIGVDNLNDYYDVRIKQFRLGSLIGRKGFTFIQSDIESFEKMEALFRQYRFDAVVNLAARAGVRYSMVNPFVYETTNTMGTLNLLECMRRSGVKKFVLASTSSLYAGQAMPYVETLPVNTPISPYAASKKGAEVMAYSYHHLYGLDVSVVRYFTVYGPAGRPDMSVFRFIKWVDEGSPIKLYGDGEQARDFTYVDDIARGTIAALKPLGYEIINLGGGKQPVTINAMIGTIEKLLGKKAQINYLPENESDMRETWADISKAARLLGWAPQVGLDEGLSRCVQWHLAHKSKWPDVALGG